MNKEQLLFLYQNYANDKGFESFDEFASLMSNKESREVFFKESNKDLGFSDFNEFESTLGIAEDVNKKEESDSFAQEQAVESPTSSVPTITLSEEELQEEQPAGVFIDKGQDYEPDVEDGFKVDSIKKAPEGIKRTSDVKLEGQEFPSTVLMSSHGDYSPPDAEGKYVSFPKLFPKNPEKQTKNPEDWILAENDDQAYELAKERGEVLYFETPEEALDVAKGSWKQNESTEKKESDKKEISEEDVGFWSNKWNEF